MLLALTMLVAASIHDSALLKNIMAVGGVITCAGTVIVSLYKLHGFLMGSSARYRAWRQAKAEEKQRQKEMPGVVKRISEEWSEMKTNMSEMMTMFQATFGSGSLAEDVAFLKNQEENRFWLQRKVAFRCDAHGSIYKMSQALLVLAGTISERDLERAGWRRLAAHNPDQLRDWFTDWSSAAGANSPHSGVLDIVDLQGNSRGKWTFQVMPVGQHQGTPAWEGSIYPVCAEAIAFARSHGWEER